MFTAKEGKILRFLMTCFSDHSINHVAKECDITARGTYKILKKLEKEQIVSYKEISNIKSYSINFDNPLILSYLEIVLKDERTNQPKIKIRLQDLSKMKDICKACLLFGSYITGKKEPNDIDILFVFEKKDYKKFDKELESIRLISPYKVHDMIQAPIDILDNLKKQDKAILDIIRNGVVLWGHDFIARSVKDAHTK